VQDPTVAAEVNLLEEDIREGETGLVRVRNTLSNVDLQMVQAQGQARAIEEEINSIMEELSRLENETSATVVSEEDLRSDIEALEAELERLRAEREDTGNNIRRFVGDGNRQYLTGLIMGGARVLILVDSSASMLDSTIVNIIRRRNMNDEAKRSAAKWIRTKRTVEWLVAQLPPPSQYQMYTFNAETRAMLPGTEGQWLEVADTAQLDRAMQELENTIPVNGTNLETLFNAVANLSPPPDNIYLITDGLPTLGSRAAAGGTVSGRDRERLFEAAVRELPKGIPVNVILQPLEGDPMATSLYWQLAVSTDGSFLNPASDWP
jgi:archaellum component FlaC